MCIEELKTILIRVCANPSNPSFNHYLFETIASLVRYICAATPTAVDAFEGMLFPPFQQVLQADIAEFTPYVFQVHTAHVHTPHTAHTQHTAHLPGEGSCTAHRAPSCTTHHRAPRTMHHAPCTMHRTNAARRPPASAHRTPTRS